MKIAIFFVLMVVLGIASCDMVCIQFKLATCFVVQALPHSSNPICASNNELTECLRNGARECGVESEPVVGDVLARYTETCKDGTELNDLYKKHRICLFQDAAIGNGMCMLPVVSKIMSLGSPSPAREYQERAMKVACKYGDSGNKCIDDNINATCGVEALAFRQHLSNPAIRLTDQACEEIADETNEIRYSLQQRAEHSVHSMAPHTQLLSATGPHAGSIQIASTVIPRFDEPVSGATISSVSLQLIYVLVATVFMKLFSPY